MDSIFKSAPWHEQVGLDRPGCTNVSNIFLLKSEGPKIILGEPLVYPDSSHIVIPLGYYGLITLHVHSNIYIYEWSEFGRLNHIENLNLPQPRRRSTPENPYPP